MFNMSASPRPPAPPRRVAPVPKAPAKLALPLDETLIALLDAAIEVVASSRTAKELGVSVDRARVARVALLRGLEGLIADGFEGGTSREEGPPNGAIHEARAPNPRAAGAAPTPQPPTDPADNPEGPWAPPEDWQDQSKEPVPSYQGEVDAYYKERGWDRYLVWLSQKEWCYAYWADRPEMQEGVLPFPGATVLPLGARGSAHGITAFYGRE